MSLARMLYALARADFLERVRRYSFLVTLLFAVYLGYAAATGRISLRLGDYRGLYTSAWVGAMVSLITTTFVSLIGFYVVKNSVDRDRQTGVGQILASTPLSRRSYLLGKFASNFAVLASMVGVLALAAIAMQFLIAEDRVVHAWALLSPFLLLSLPAVALTAAVAVLFETIRFLRGGFGNVLWFFTWGLAMGLPGTTNSPRIDPSGLWTVYQSMAPAAQAEAEVQQASAKARAVVPIHLTPLAEPAHAPAFGRVFVAELRLALKGYRWWWYAVAAGLLIAQFAAPLEISCGPLLAAAWIWPVLIWSALGTREARFGTQQLLFSCPRILSRQLPAAWLAGVLVTALSGAGAGVRLAIAGQSASVLAWGAGALFVPSLALALGVWSGTSRFFEGAYTALWYVGPLNRVPGLDFTGGGSGALAGRYAFCYLGLTAILLATAFFGRARQLRQT